MIVMLALGQADLCSRPAIWPG